MTSLWTAEVDAHGRSSAPVRIYSADRIAWNATAASPLATGNEEQLIGIASAVHRSRGETLVVLRYRESRWTVEELSVPVSSAYLAVAALGDTVVVGMIGAESGAASDANSVWMMTSTDFGSSWHKPILVSRSANGPAHYISAAIYLGQAHLIWTQDGLQSSRPTQTIRHIAGKLFSDSIGVRDELVLEAPAWLVRSAVTACGLHVVLADATNSLPGLAYLRWSGRWESGRILSDYFVDAADIAPRQDGGVYVAASVAKVSDSRDGPRSLLLVRLVSARRKR